VKKTRCICLPASVDSVFHFVDDGSRVIDLLQAKSKKNMRRRVIEANDDRHRGTPETSAFCSRTPYCFHLLWICCISFRRTVINCSICIAPSTEDRGRITKTIISVHGQTGTEMFSVDDEK